MGPATTGPTLIEGDTMHRHPKDRPLQPFSGESLVRLRNRHQRTLDADAGNHFARQAIENINREFRLRTPA